MRSRHGLIALILPLALTACGVKVSDDDNAVALKDQGTTYAGLAFTITDYKSSSLSFYDFASGAITPALAGQSGDPFVKWLGDRLYLFNRSNDSLNFITIDPRAASARPSAQVVTAGAGLGDPHDALRLADGNLLLAQWSKGTLVVVDPATGTLVQTIDGSGLDFSGNPKASFHPEALWSRPVNGADEIYVAHQSRDDQGPAEGTQQLFVFTYAGRTLTAVDVDPAAAGVQGIKLHVSNPGLLRAQADSTLFVGGLCSVYQPERCTQSGIDRVDLATRQVDLVLDLAASPHKGNGPLVWGGGDDYYAMAATAANGGVGEAYVLKLNVTTRAADKVHAFPAGSPGCCGLFADPSTGRLYVGDAKADGRGLLTVYGQGLAAPGVVELSGNPYTGSLVAK